MKYVLTLLFAFSIADSDAQKGNLSIAFCPLALVDEFSFPTLQAGIECRLSKNIKWYNEFGIRYRRSYYEKAATDSSFIASNGFKLKTELRYYFNNRHSRKRRIYYAAFNFFLTKNQHNTAVSYHYKADTALLRSDAFGVRKKVTGFNFIYGFQRRLSGKLSMDLYAGVGMRFISTQTFNKEYDRKRDDMIIHPVDLNYDAWQRQNEASEPKRIMPNLSMGIRFCFDL